MRRAGAPPRGMKFALFEPPPVDAVAVEERAAALGKRSIKKAAKVAGLKLAVSMMDLTTLEGKDTPGKVRQMCQKALRPLDSDGSIGPCGAVCVYPNLVPVAKEALRGSTVKVASVATAARAKKVSPTRPAQAKRTNEPPPAAHRAASARMSRATAIPSTQSNA